MIILKMCPNWQCESAPLSAFGCNGRKKGVHMLSSMKRLLAIALTIIMVMGTFTVSVAEDLHDDHTLPILVLL